MELWEVRGKVSSGPVDMPQPAAASRAFLAKDWQDAIKKAPTALTKGEAEILDISEIRRLHTDVHP